MVRRNYSTQTININQYNLYISFYYLLINKKFTIKYTSNLLFIFLKFKLYFNYLGWFSINTYLFNFYKNVVHLNKLIYFHNFSNYKYIDLSVYNNIKYTYSYYKYNFIFTLGSSNTLNKQTMLKDHLINNTYMFRFFIFFYIKKFYLFN